jgi:hypothetical protein
MPLGLEEWLIWLSLFVATPLVAVISCGSRVRAWSGRGWKAHSLAALLIFLGFGFSFMWFWFIYVVGLD